jgi:translation initiation factor IF-2
MPPYLPPGIDNQRNSITSALMNINSPPPSVAPQFPQGPAPIPQQGLPMPPPYSPPGMPQGGTPLPGVAPPTLPIVPRQPGAMAPQPMASPGAAPMPGAAPGGMPPPPQGQQY